MNEPTPVYLVLRDKSPEMVMAWLEAFSDDGPWSVGSGDILRTKADAIVSPANSYGYMDGGIDLAYRNFFGLGLQNRLQAVLQRDFNGCLPVGQAVVIPTLKESIPHMVAAPTMERPHNVANTENAYVAMKAALRAVQEFNGRSKEPIQKILIPGLCTGIGRMDPFVSAKQMRRAFDEIYADCKAGKE
jgi:O-acetyl-ADP-ribose deacetylase (regulator of RNase III)